MADKYIWGTGRRKNAIARVRICAGSGKFLVNDREVKDYFARDCWADVAMAPLKAANLVGKLDVFVNAHGGGLTGQSGAICLGLSRAILKFDQKSRPALKKAGYLTCDSRMVERKKVGLRKARADKQFSKR